MGISSSLYSAISGLTTMGNSMSVLGDNVANVNTTAFKSSRSTFQDALSQSVSTASGSKQIGSGVTLSTVDGLFAQGSFESSSSATDMAIGGQGFFMLRSSDSSEADMYTRAGEFSFDLEGNLVTSMGYFVQGWTLDDDGEREGTISDLNIGESTPPVTTQNLELIANLDSSIAEEQTEERLYDSWNATNLSQAVPSEAIDSSKYEYTSSVRVYDSQGASHDITIYFDKTTENNEWEFLVTCDPSEDMRNLDESQQDIYEPYDVYDYSVHEGAGALMYGVITFTTSGEIDSIEAYQVPPDGNVDIAQKENQITLDTDDSYFAFDANFTGEPVDYSGAETVWNPTINLNLGAQYSGVSTAVPQVIVSDGGAISDANSGAIITSQTQWNSVFDSNGNPINNGDIFIFEGFDHNGSRVTLTYEVVGTNDVQDLLTQLKNTFGVNAEIDDAGRLTMTDETNGTSALAVTNFWTISGSGSVPFGGVSTSPSANWYMSSQGVFDVNGVIVTDASTVLQDVYDYSAAPPGTAIANGDTFNWVGTDVSGGAVNYTYTVVDNTTESVQDILDGLETAFGGAANVTASIDINGNLRIIDHTNANSLLTITDDSYTGGGDIWDLGGSVPGTPSMLVQSAYGAEINVTTSKRQVGSVMRAVSTDTGNIPAVTALTPWDSVFEETLAGGSTTAIGVGETFVFTGIQGDGTAVSFTYATKDAGDPDPLGNDTTRLATGTIQDLLDFLEYEFKAEARIDSSGRLILTDWVADSSSYSSLLDITTITGTAATAGILPWGDTEFDVVVADIGTEDGSVVGGTVSTNFDAEALATTQYASSSTTIFQDQDGFASGFLQSVSVDTEGIITGNYSNGQVIEKVQVALANFSNLTGLNKVGGNIYTETTASGAPTTGAPGDNGLGSISPNSLEMSNVDIGAEFVKLITVQRGFQANSKIITTVDDMLNDLINIKR